MLNIVYRPTFRTRIRIALIVLITVAITITGVGSYWIAIDIIERNAARSNVISIHKSKQMLDNNLRQITVSIMTLMISDAFKDLMKDVSINDHSRYATHLSSLQPLFAQIKLSEPMTQAILVSTPIGEFYNTGYVRDTSVPFIYSEMHQRLKSEKGFTWTIGHEDRLFTNQERVISFAMEPITDFLVKDVYIVVNISEDSMKEALSSNLSENGGELLLLTQDGQEVLRSQSDLWSFIENEQPFWSQVAQEESSHFEYTFGKHDYMVNAAKLEGRTDWIVANVQKKSVLFEQMDRIHWIVVVVAGSSIIVAVMLSKMLMAFLMRPIHKLMTLMRKVESNNLSVRFEGEHADEFSRLGMRFNMMVEEINKLIETIKETEKEKRTAEVKALQAHISPHFLYNTLNTIYFKCELGDNEQVGEMVLALSRMFQLGLNDGNAITTLDKEISHVTQYLTIQQSCYADLFQYELDVTDEELYKEPILKIMLQPLVENAIVHGFKNMRHGGKISINIMRDERKLKIIVTDNGQGMDVEKVLDSIRSSQTDEKKSYALSNIYDRLQLYYGDQASMLMTSEPYEQTTVTLLLPIQVPLQVV